MYVWEMASHGSLTQNQLQRDENEEYEQGFHSEEQHRRDVQSDLNSYQFPPATPTTQAGVSHLLG